MAPSGGSRILLFWGLVGAILPSWPSVVRDPEISVGEIVKLIWGLNLTLGEGAEDQLAHRRTASITQFSDVLAFCLRWGVQLKVTLTPGDSMSRLMCSIFRPTRQVEQHLWWRTGAVNVLARSLRGLYSCLMLHAHTVTLCTNCG